MTKLNWNKFKPLFNSWDNKIKPFFDKEGLDPIYNYLKEQSNLGIKVIPSSHNLWKFTETDIKNLKVVIIGECPLNTIIEKVSCSDGLLFSSYEENIINYRLKNFYEGIEKELYNGLNLSYIKKCSLSYLTDQGVLFLNSSLTTDIENKSHSKLWKPFMEYFLSEVINYTGVPVILLGISSKFSHLLQLNHVFILDNPKNQLGASWDTKKVFTEINKIIKNSNNHTIEWLNTEVPF